MNFLLTSAILRGVWAIDPITASSMSGFIVSLLNKNVDEEITAKEILPFAVTSSGVVRGKIEDSQKGDIAIIPIVGALTKYSEMCGAAGMQKIGAWVQNADANPNIKGIILRIDSPGGTVDGTEQLANIVKETKKPIVAFVDGMMASAAMWIGSACDEIIAGLPNDQIGSIGVMISFADMQPALEAQGVKFHNINADQSSEKNKTFQDAREGNYDAIKKEILNPIAELFIETIKNNRPNVKKEELTGKMFFVKDLKGSLIDEVGDFNYAVERINALHQPIIKTIKY